MFASLPRVVRVHCSALPYFLSALTHAYRHLAKTLILWEKTHPRNDFAVDHFLHYYNIKKEAQYWHYFSPKPNKHLLSKMPNKVLDWKPKWVFIDGTTSEFGTQLVDKEREPQVPRSWGSIYPKFTKKTNQPE